MGKTTRVRTPEKQAERAAKAVLDEIMAMGAKIELPVAQRDPERVLVVPTPGADWQHPERTLKRLTKAERLNRSGAISKPQLAAINLYVEAIEVAYGSCLKATSYGDGGGSSPTGSASAAHTRQLTRIGEDYRYRRARAALLAHQVAPFERIVVDGDGMIEVIMEMDRPPAEEIGRTAAWEAGRALVRECCDRLCVEFAGELRIDPPSPLAQTMTRMNEHVKAVQAPVARPISLALDEVILRAAVEGATGLFVAASVVATLARENGLPADMVSYGGLPLIVQDHWNWGWVVQKAVVGEAA